MSKARKSLMAFMILVGTCVAPMAALQSMGQELTDENGNVVAQNTAQSSSKKGGGFVDIVFGSGVVGMLLWFALFGDGALAIYFSVDCFILIKPEKLMPARLIDQVQKAMSEGDIVAAMEACQNTPSVMSNILTAAFQHVEEGFDVIQEAVNAASDLEQEKLMQRLTWVSVCSNLGPSLGLLGTVQGMILTFQALAQGGAGCEALGLVLKAGAQYHGCSEGGRRPEPREQRVPGSRNRKGQGLLAAQGQDQDGYRQGVWIGQGCGELRDGDV